ncbi:hypothetical protein AAHC03_022684 [Spirometra sp. Aus1]
MRDDRGRLVLRIDNASIRDSGVYRCHGKKDTLDVFLSVHPQEHFPTGKHGLPIVPLAAGMIKHFKMFSSDNSEKIILHCPLTKAQTVLAWEWREPIPPDSQVARSLPSDASPSLTVSYSEPGIYSSGNVQIGPDLLWARDPSYYEIDWELYDPINVQVKMLNSSEKEFYEHLGSSEPSIDYSALYGSLGMEKERSSLQDRMELRSQPKLIEGYPAKLACVFRPITSANSVRPAQVASWFRGDRSLPQPPFHVNNSNVATEGISVISVRAYTVSSEAALGSGDKNIATLPFENITCIVSSRVNDEHNYTVTSNASLTLEVIRQPRIVDVELMSTECSLGDYAQLVCVVLANGKPNISIDFSSTAGQTSQPVGAEDSTLGGERGDWRQLTESYSLKIYRSEMDSEKPMLHRLTVVIRGAKREHHGAYRCRVTNAAGQAQYVGEIRVRSEPQLTIHPVQSTYFLGRRPLIISCLVSGYPLAVANPTIIPSGGTATMTTASLSDEESSSTISPSNQELGDPEEAEKFSPVSLKITNDNMDTAQLVTVKLTSLRIGVYEGINATYSVVISYHLLNQATARCEYVHTDRTVISDEMEIKEATPPAAPQIVALCAGPGAVIFGVSNPPVSPENEPTDKIVSQRVLFAPSSEFHSASNLASKSIILDVEGQPRSETVDANEEAVQDALENAPAQRKMSATDPPLVTVPITNLIPGTNYTFEWSSANQFSLTTTSQFTTSTAPLAPPLKPTHYIFLMPTSHHLRMAVFLDDPCPYEDGGRAELGNILIRYRRAVRRRDEPNSPFTGYGNWTESQVCIKNRPKNSVDPLSAVDAAIGSDVSRILWSGDEAIQCELKVENTAVEYEVAVATTNRFGMSPWLPAIYRPEEAVRSAYLYRSRAFRKKTFWILSTFVLLPIFDLF